MQVKKDTPEKEIKVNFYKLSRLVHPDKCSHPRAGDAAAVVNQAYGTLTNGIKKRAYDLYGKALPLPHGLPLVEPA